MKNLNSFNPLRLLPHSMRPRFMSRGASSAAPENSQPGSRSPATLGAEAGRQPVPQVDCRPKRENQGSNSPSAFQNNSQAGFGHDLDSSSSRLSGSRPSSTSSYMSGESVFMPSSPHSGNDPSSSHTELSGGRRSSNSVDSSMYRSSEHGSHYSSDHGSFISSPLSAENGPSTNRRSSFESSGSETRNSDHGSDSTSPPSPTPSQLRKAFREERLARNGGGAYTGKLSDLSP